MNEQIYGINVRRFIQSTEYQSKKLAECIEKIHEFQNYEDWTNVKQAQQNASQIIKRIRSDIKQILKIRAEILAPLDDKCSSAIVNQIDEQLKEISKRVEQQANEIDSIHPPYYSFEVKGQDMMLQSSWVSPDPFMLQVKVNDTLKREKDLCGAYEQLQRDCEDLQVIMQTFSQEVLSQKPTIDSIEKNISMTNDHVESGALSLRQALNYKAMNTAVGGALIGTCIGGPVGFLAGAKLGAVCGLGSGLIGYYFTKRLGKPVE